MFQRTRGSGVTLEEGEVTRVPLRALAAGGASQKPSVPLCGQGSQEEARKDDVKENATTLNLKMENLFSK